jgi:hypothetical protein
MSAQDQDTQYSAPSMPAPQSGWEMLHEHRRDGRLMSSTERLHIPGGWLIKTITPLWETRDGETSRLRECNVSVVFVELPK